VNDHFELKIFHYHYHTGGVSTVVRQAIRAFHDHLPEIRSVELVAGAIPREFRSHIEDHGGTCTEMPQIGYRQQAGDSPHQNRKSVAREADKLAEILLGSFGSENSVWWVHNYHLGKNVVFTQALLNIIHSGRSQRMILQIHDFPECGRFGNLAALGQALSLDPYPVSPWVRYTVLNPRDREILIAAGIPEQSVFLLENPVFRGPDPERGKAIRPVLQRLFGDEFPRFDPRAPLLLYPIRTIRRKNALEALLLCLLLEREANILITLPGTSVSERPYSDLVERLFAEQLCPGLWGIGSKSQNRALSFEDLVAAGDLVLSTSVQEGFGYLFVNSLLWSLPLAARDLDTLAGLKDLFHGHPVHFYDTIRVPVLDPPKVAEAYRAKIRGLSALIPPEEQERLTSEVEQLLREDRVDFSFLPVEAQERLLREITAAESPVLRICRRENRLTLSKIEEMLAGQIESATPARSLKAAEVDRRFGAAAYAAGFRRILQSSGSLTGKPREHLQNRTGSIAQRVQRAFLTIENLRLLYDY
jgi:hypothetical protein